jgi:hypothetical protein
VSPPGRAHALPGDDGCNTLREGDDMKKAKAARKRSATKDLSARKASAVKGGLLPARAIDSKKVAYDWVRQPT